jgi:putative modified peptide
VLFERIATIFNGSPLHSPAPRGDRFADSATCGTRLSNRGNAVAATQLDPLLDRLSTDDAFREKILGDPAAGLAEYGFRVDPAEIPAVRRLPSKKDLVAQREEIKGGVADHVCLIFFAQAT